jgi:hypothetical protein
MFQFAVRYGNRSVIVIEVQRERYIEVVPCRVVSCRVWLDPVSEKDTASRSMSETKT